MATLLEKIEANAAKKLPLPPKRGPREELARYKEFLKVENARLAMMHKAGGGGRDVCRARSAVMDVLLRYILEAVMANLASPSPQSAKLSIVAIGGYGRGELNPFSDIDLMFLHDIPLPVRGKPSPFLSELMDGLLYTLWDLGFKVGHSVRNVEDCVQVANSNMQSKTSLIEARLVTGDRALFDKMQAAVLAKCVRGFEKEYIAARLEDQATRRAKFGNSALMQEPNVKNGCGGLRDYQNLVWMTFFKYRVRSLGELKERGMVVESELKQLDAAYDFLLWVRNDLHYRAGRAVDALPKNLQPTLATDFGYTERSPSRRLEKFMRDVYRHMRNIHLITRTMEQRLALLPEPHRLPSLREIFRKGRERAKQQIVDGFKIVEGEIQPGPRSFKEQPRRMMRAFLHAQQRGLRLNPDLAQEIRNQLALVNGEFMRDPHVHETFLEILNQRGNVAPILREMHDVGLLGKFIPEFGKLTCLVQHEFYHQYAADEHTLVCIEKLDRVWEAKEAPYAAYAELFQHVERPFVLYLALLLHDAGKAINTGKHAELGAKLAQRVARRLRLDGATTHILCLLIENHLTMTQTSQRRDLDDPAVIRNFAAQVQTRGNLGMLTLHTFADSQGTSDQLWNGFKDSLLWNLFDKTDALLKGGTDFIRAEEKQIELLEAEVAGLLPKTFSREEIHAHFANLPARYFHIHTARQIMADMTMAHRFMHFQIAEEDKALEPVLNWHNEPDRGYTSVHICTWDRLGLFSKIAGSLTASGLNILSAQIFTREDGIILDTFFVTDARTGLLVNKEERESFEKKLRDVLTGEVDLTALVSKLKQPKTVYKSVEGEQLPTVIAFDNAVSDTRTVIDIETEDRVGLLYTISEVFAKLHLNISLAKIGTEKGAAVDSFYVVPKSGGKIVEEERQREIERELRAAIQSLK